MQMNVVIIDNTRWSSLQIWPPGWIWFPHWLQLPDQTFHKYIARKPTIDDFAVNKFVFWRLPVSLKLCDVRSGYHYRKSWNVIHWLTYFWKKSSRANLFYYFSTYILLLFQNCTYLEVSEKAIKFKNKNEKCFCQDLSLNFTFMN